jgi:hypothetical protein
LVPFSLPLVIGANIAAARWNGLRWSAGLVTGMVVAMTALYDDAPIIGDPDLLDFNEVARGA